MSLKPPGTLQSEPAPAVSCPGPSVPVGEETDLTIVDQLVSQYGGQAEALIPLLQGLQDHYRYLPPAALQRLCDLTPLTPAQVTGVATFYRRFRHQPVGHHLISVCHGTACHVKGAELITAALQRHLQLSTAADTTADGLFTLQRVDCLGCCTLAPVVQIDGITYGHLTPDGIPAMIEGFLGGQKQSTATPEQQIRVLDSTDLAEIRIGEGSCCLAGGSREVREALETAVRDLGAAAVVTAVGCVGMCHQTPLVEVRVPGREPVYYARVQATEASEIVQRHLAPRGLGPKVRVTVGRVLDQILTDEAWVAARRPALAVNHGAAGSFLSPQRHLATEYYGTADPLDLNEYRRQGGFAAWQKCRSELSPQQVIDLVRQAGLRGRGGAGFPTGHKWQLVREAPGERKYVICNGDEGDPGAFMDRMLLESYPYRIIEGLLITAYAVGAHEAILYVRAEYPLAVQRLSEALARCEAAGLSEELAAATGQRVAVELRQGAGAFVCGEETGLLASLEGRRGTPRMRPPYPAQQGLWGCPTCVNNVETLALVPWIVRHGAAAFTALGTAASSGTKVFSLTGKVMRGGLIEVPMGITVRQVVEEIGGGVAPGRQFKAVQIGGPSGGCIPANQSDLPIDYESLQQAGAIMGSGGLVVMDDRDCMVDVARYFLEFTQRESCGKCTPCRVGTRRLLDLLEGLCQGRARPGDLERLEDLAQMVQQTSLCGLGQTAPNPVLSTLRHFRDEYEAHLQGRCPAGKCRALITYHITDRCLGCTKCAQACPVGAIALTPYQQHHCDPHLCIRCDTCRQICPVDAVEVN